MKLSSLFNMKTGAAVGAALLAATAFTHLTGEQSPSQTPPIGGMYDQTSVGWGTMAEAGNYKQVTSNARDLLLQSEPSFKDVFQDTALVFMEPRNANDTRYANFIITNENLRAIRIYKNEAMYENAYQMFSRVHKEQANPPSRDEFKSMMIATSIANETAHYWQSKENPEFIKKLLTDGVGCSDKIALEQSSDAFMVAVAVKMHQKLESLGPAGERQKNALEWAMGASMFGDFAQYAKNPLSADSQDEFKNYMSFRKGQYESVSNCEVEKSPPLTPAAKKALKGPVRVLGQ